MLLNVNPIKYLNGYQNNNEYNAHKYIINYNYWCYNPTEQ